MAEWSIAAVLKTVEGHTSGGSNPSLSAIKPDFQAFVVLTPNFTPSFGHEIMCKFMPKDNYLQSSIFYITVSKI